MSTAATTAPAALTILSQLLLSISPLLRSWGRRSVWPVEDMVVSERRRFSGRRTRLRLGPAGTMRGTTRGDRCPAHLRLRSAHVREGHPRRWGSPPDRGRDGARLGALARRRAPADRRARGGPDGRPLRGARRADAGRRV